MGICSYLTLTPLTASAPIRGPISLAALENARRDSPSLHCLAISSNVNSSEQARTLDPGPKAGDSIASRTQAPKSPEASMREMMVSGETGRVQVRVPSGRCGRAGRGRGGQRCRGREGRGEGIPCWVPCLRQSWT